MEIMDPDAMDQNVVGIASLLYLIANDENSLRKIIP